MSATRTRRGGAHESKALGSRAGRRHVDLASPAASLGRDGDGAVGRSGAALRPLASGRPIVKLLTSPALSSLGAALLALVVWGGGAGFGADAPAPWERRIDG